MPNTLDFRNNRCVRAGVAPKPVPLVSLLAVDKAKMQVFGALDIAAEDLAIQILQTLATHPVPRPPCS
ncbi:MAG: hypothetical protein AAGF98_07140 [Cyanobacteria bacterium P01_H01_bin.153]